MGGLLLSLAAMLAIMTAKKAFAPNFHEQKMELAAGTIGPGGSMKIQYKEDPGYFLPPGFPSRLLVMKKDTQEPVAQLGYRQLTEKEVVAGPIQGEGAYLLQGDLHVCEQPGVADCAKLVLSQEILVKQGAPAESVLPLDLRAIAVRGREAGAQAKQP